MKILMTGVFNPEQHNGRKVHFFELAYQMHKRGHKITCIVPAGKIDKKYFNIIDVISLPMEYKDHFLWVYLLNILMLFQAMKVLSDGFDLIYYRFSLLPCSWLRFIARKVKPFPTLISEHNSWLEREYRVRAHKESFINAMRKYQMKDALATDSVITTNEGTKDMLVFSNIPKDKISVIRNGSNIEQIFPLSQEKRNYLKKTVLNLNDEVLVMGYAGDISNLNKLEDLINTYLLLFNQNPLCLLILGSGEGLDKLEEKITGSETQNRIIVRENVPYEEMNMWLNCMDLAFLPQVKEMDNFTSPIKLYNYASAGLPTIATKSKTVKDYEKAGWLHTYEHHDINALKDIVLKYLKNREMLFEEGKIARQYALENFNYEKIAEQVHSLILEKTNKL